MTPPKSAWSFTEVANWRLDVVGTLLAERGYPLGSLEYLAESVERLRLERPSTTVGLSPSSPVVRRSFSPLAQELLARARELENEGPAAGNLVSVTVSMLPVYRDMSTYGAGFVLADVRHDVAAWLFPCAYPVDIVDFGFAFLRPGRDRVRFFGELTGIYCDAVRLSGQFIGLRAELLSALRDLAGTLSGVVRSSSLDEGAAANADRDNSAAGTSDRADPSEYVTQETSPSAGDCGDHSVGDRQVAGADSSAPATVPDLLIVGTVADMHAVTMPMVEKLGSPHIGCLEQLDGQDEAVDYSGHSPHTPVAYQNALIDSRIINDPRLQRVLDEAFAPGWRHHAEVISLEDVRSAVDA